MPATILAMHGLPAAQSVLVGALGGAALLRDAAPRPLTAVTPNETAIAEEGEALAA